MDSKFVDIKGTASFLCNGSCDGITHSYTDQWGNHNGSGTPPRGFQFNMLYCSG